MDESSSDVPVPVKFIETDDVLKTLQSETAKRMLNESNVGFRTVSLGAAASRPTSSANTARGGRLRNVRWLGHHPKLP